MSNLNSNYRTPEALPDHKQKIFFELHGLSGNAYQKKLNEAKIRWAMKTKLSSD